MTFFKNVARALGAGIKIPGQGAIAVSGGRDGKVAAGHDIKRIAYRKPTPQRDHSTSQEQGAMTENTSEPAAVAKSARFLGSLKDALAAAGRDETGDRARAQSAASATSPADAAPHAAVALPPPVTSAAPAAMVTTPAAPITPPVKSAAEAARDARATTGSPSDKKTADPSAPPTTRVVKQQKAANAGEPERTQLVRGKKPVERGTFDSDPVVGWLVIVGGPGIGQYRPIFEGNNAIGRGTTQRIALDFGDDSISSEEQAYIRYDSRDRSFLFVPNLAKTNVVSLNNKRPTGAVELVQMDVITMGRTQLVFVPFCGSEFDWSELIDGKD